MGPDAEWDDHDLIERTCFVVMPFGEKIDLEKVLKGMTGVGPVQAVPGVAQPSIIDFDRIFRTLIKPAIDQVRNEGLRIDCVRSDEVGHSGFIHREMLEYVANADIAIVDITTQNANVFYELGVRHCFRRFTTILIRRAGTQIPFNIAGMRVFEYSDDPQTTEGEDSPLESSKKRLAAIITASFDQKDNDSLVHNLLPNTSVVRESWPIMEQFTVWYDVLDREKTIPDKGPNGKELVKSVGYITGDVLHVRDVDAWVNPENTKFQMARYHDGSVSSNIRYFGARRNHGGHVVEDTIAEALERSKGEIAEVEPGTVIATCSGALHETNNVMLLLHVAALQGEPGKGYQPIRDYPNCVRRVLAEVDRLNALPAIKPEKVGVFSRKKPDPSPWTALQGLQCTTVLFPLFGTRSSGQHPQTVTENLYRAAVNYLQQNKNSHINTVYFLAYTLQDRELCERALAMLLRERKVQKSRRSEQTQAASS